MSHYEEFRYLWRTDDREWLRERKQLWKGVQAQLKSLVYDGPVYFKENIRYHKHYFFTGELLECDDKWEKAAPKHLKKYWGKPFPMPLVCVLWYLPEINSNVVDKLKDYVSTEEKRLYIKWGETQFIADREETGAEFFFDRAPIIDELLCPRSIEEYIQVKVSGLLPQSKERVKKKLKKNPQSLFLGHYNRKQREALINSQLRGRIRYSCGNYLMLFGFDLLRDVLISVKDYDYRELDRNGHYELSFRFLIENTLMGALLSQPRPKDKVHWGVPAQFYDRLYAFFEEGVSPEIDEMWANAKREYADKQNKEG